MEVKVGIEYEGTHFLFVINKNISLRDNVETICKRNSLMASYSYGLKFNYTRNGVTFDNYVTDENFNEIQNGFTLKLVESLDSIIERIFKNMVYDRQQSFDDLFALSTDPGFVQSLVQNGRDKDVLLWLTDKYLSGKELSACLLTLLHLLKKQYIKDMPSVIVKNIVRCIKNDTPPTPPEQLQYALAVLCQILFLKGHDLSKQIIILELTINDLIPFIWSQEHSSLQLNTIMLINAMVKIVKGDKRNQLIRHLNRSKNREYIFKNIIQSTNITKAMAHELYIYQTYVLSLYAEALNSNIESTSSPLLKELEPYEDDVSRSSTFIDFEDVSRSRSNSTDTILENIDDIRLSFASVESEKSLNAEFLNSPNSHWEDQISYLTFECLLHYKKYHYKNFCQSRVEENTYQPGIYISSERVTKLLANILHIGIEPTRTGQSYHPLVFNSSLKLQFFLELFSRTMWLLSKTRREMRACTYDDYSKVLVVLEKQIKMVLEQKPMDYSSLTKQMLKITYDAVDKQWQKEKEFEWKTTYKSNPSVQIIKKEFRIANEELIFEKRIKTLQKGDIFPRLPEKRGKQQYFYLKLSENKRMVIWGEWDEVLKEFKEKEPERFNISDITHFVIGKACPHIRDGSIKFPDRAFSILFEDGAAINFVAKDRRTANLWIDGFNLILGKPHRSADYEGELEILLEMDCALHLLELQNIPLPNTPPVVPPLPKHMRIKPPLPPKSPIIMMRKSLAPLYKNSQTIYNDGNDNI